MLDLIISGGTIVDGTGADRFQGDIGIVGEKIVEVGKVTTPAKRRIDAAGLFVTPGFVDLHTHFDGQASWDSELAPSRDNGVTSVVMGNCGVGFAPARPDKHDWLINLLEGVEDIPGTALAEGLTWDWETFPQYLDALATRRYTVDVGGYLPHAAVRTYVMGDRGGDHTQHPNDDQIAVMQDMAAEAMLAGAVGFSTSRTAAHVTREGKTIGTLDATSRELLGIAAGLRRTGLGTVQLISDAYQCPDDEVAEAELRLIRAMAETSGRPLSFTVMQAPNVPYRWRRMMDAAGEMVRDGHVVRCQVAPRGVGALLSFASSLNPFMSTATFQSIKPLTAQARAARLRDPATRAQILAEYRAMVAEGGRRRGMTPFGNLFRMTDPVDYEPAPETSLRAEAERLGRDPAEYAYDALLEQDCQRVLLAPVNNFSERNLNVVHEMLTDPNALFGLSDAGAHVATLIDGSFPTTSLSLWSRGNRAGRKIAIEALVHGYTQRNARHVGWLDRGVLAPGYLADLNVIDIDSLAVSPPRLVSDLPAGGSRFFQDVRGYKLTAKRGRVTLQDGKRTDELPGQLMRGAQPAPA